MARTLICHQRVFNVQFQPLASVYVYLDANCQLYYAESAVPVDDLGVLQGKRLTHYMIYTTPGNFIGTIRRCADHTRCHTETPHLAVPYTPATRPAANTAREIMALEKIYSVLSTPYLPAYRGGFVTADGYVRGLCFDPVKYSIREALDANVIRDVPEFIDRVKVGLQSIHGWGLVHDNISSCSIRVTEDGEPRIVDFAACKPVGSRREGYRNGTLGYTRPAELVELENDFYSLRILLFHMQTLLATDPCAGHNNDKVVCYIGQCHHTGHLLPYGSP
ncbi:hypothetical protein IWQ60_009889 [Tieghemiomyces parasiticus]|uniref:Protein kinase domain-containing protein n=1 Tax=Tieghemiomyces parasiticus TaxID=78921 RepID=A0A9W8DJ69_9FUNG|nr:hypothetical protein IWQ60_009889 [Tieghemiomyces parasiticus]